MRAKTKGLKKSKVRVHTFWFVIAQIIAFVGTTVLVNWGLPNITDLQQFVISNASSYAISHIIASPCVIIMVRKYLK